MWEGLFHVCYIGDTIVRIALRSTFHFCLIRIIFQFISLFPVGSPIVYDKIDRLSFGIRQGRQIERHTSGPDRILGIIVSVMPKLQRIRIILGIRLDQVDKVGGLASPECLEIDIQLSVSDPHIILINTYRVRTIDRIISRSLVLSDGFRKDVMDRVNLDIMGETS